MLAMALHLREQELSLCDIAAPLVITTGKKKDQRHADAARARRTGGRCLILNEGRHPEPAPESHRY
ncbi:hypothetical protein ACWGH2_36860 [Streptomyces sp. NPDC054871]